MAALSDPHAASHLALLARLELLHQSSLLRHTPSSPHAEDEKEAVGQEDSVLVPDEDKETVVEGWEEIRDLCRLMGDGLRDAALRPPLAHSSLPSTLSDLLRLALALPSPLISPASFASGPASLGAVAPDGLLAEAAVEILRAAGNSSYDCDEARANLLQANFPQLVLTLLHALLGPADAAVDLREANGAFRLAKTSLGALMNVAMDQEDIQTALLGMDGALEVLLRMANAVYAPTPWGAAGADDKWATREERATVGAWAWKVFGDVAALEGAPAVIASLGPSLLPLLLPSILAYLPPSPTPADWPPYPASLLSTDLTLLTTAVQTLESHTLDTAAWQAALYARRADFASLLDFVERAGTPAVLPSEDDDDDSDDDEGNSVDDLEKRFGSLKGGVVKCAVAVFGEDAVGEQVFAAEDGAEISRLKQWLEQEGLGEREDMVICAVLSLGNLARSEAHCLALLQPPFDLLPALLPLLVPSTDVKVQHALVGLLKNLSVPDGNKAAMTEAGVMEGVTLGLGALEDRRDVVGSVQGGAVGVVKNLCKGSAAKAARLIQPSPAHDNQTILPLLLALHRRSNDFALRAESARVLVNAARSLFSLSASDPAPSAEVEQAKLALGSSEEVVRALGELLTGGAKGGYGVLVVEGVLGLAILASSGFETAKLVAKVLLAPSAADPAAPSTSPTEATSEDSSSVAVAPPSSSPAPLALLASILSPSSTSPKNVATTPELKGNVCTLVTAAGRGAAGEADKARFRAVLEGWVVEEGEKGGEGLEKARGMGLRVLEG